MRSLLFSRLSGVLLFAVAAPALAHSVGAAPQHTPVRAAVAASTATVTPDTWAWG
jgi:hypothetical protein